MSSITAKKIKGGIEVNIHESTSYGVEDAKRRRKVLLSDIDQLSVLPPTPPEGYLHTKMFWMPEGRLWIGFNLISWQEIAYGPNEERYLGPFKINEPPPSEGEELDAKIAGKITTRLMELYEVVAK